MIIPIHHFGGGTHTKKKKGKRKEFSFYKRKENTTQRHNASVRRSVQIMMLALRLIVRTICRLAGNKATLPRRQSCPEWRLFGGKMDTSSLAAAPWVYFTQMARSCSSVTRFSVTVGLGFRSQGGRMSWKALAPSEIDHRYWRGGTGRSAAFLRWSPPPGGGGGRGRDEEEEEEKIGSLGHHCMSVSILF